MYGSRGSLECPGDRNGRPIKLHLDDGTVIDDERILEYAPSYRLSPLAAELFGGERVWTYSLEFNDDRQRDPGAGVLRAGRVHPVRAPSRR